MTKVTRSDQKLPSASSDKILSIAKSSSEKKPFFIKNKALISVEKKEVQVLSIEESKDKTDESKLDYFKLNAKLNVFREDVAKEINKKYKYVFLENKENEKKKFFLLKKLGATKNTIKKSWFKASVDMEPSKLIYYISSYSCNENIVSNKKSPLKNICLDLQVYAFYNEKWERSTLSIKADYIYWKNGIPFMRDGMEFLGKFSEDSHFLEQLVPFPTIGGNLSLLKYENNKFIWQDFGELEWAATSEREAIFFQKETDDYNDAASSRSEQ